LSEDVALPLIAFRISQLQPSRECMNANMFLMSDCPVDPFGTRIFLI
jgi:hypothetical protein